MWGCGALAWQGSLSFALALQLVAPCGFWIATRLSELLKPAGQSRCKDCMPAPGRAACVWRWRRLVCCQADWVCNVYVRAVCFLSTASEHSGMWHACRLSS